MKPRKRAVPWEREAADVLREMVENGATQKELEARFPDRHPNNLRWKASAIRNGKQEKSADLLYIEMHCLRCGGPFMSTDRRRNRICAPCKGTKVWVFGGSTGALRIGGDERRPILRH